MLEQAGATELRRGVWRWTAFYPGWNAEVACVAYAPGATLVLVDPLAPPEPAAARRFWRALDAEVAARARPPHVLLSVRWHERHSARVAERYPGTTVWAPAGAVPKLARAPDRVFGARRPPAGVVALETARSDEVVLWLPRARTLFTGDTLLGGTRRPLRVCPQGWLPRGVTRTALAASLRPLLELPVELIVPAHGEPVASEPLAVLERALADAA